MNKTEVMDLMCSEEVCGTCTRSGISEEGDLCKCSRDGKYHKYYDTACMEHAKGGAK